MSLEGFNRWSAMCAELEGDPNREARMATDRAIIAYLSRDQRRVTYYYTHGPWDEQHRTCLSCGASEIEIHAQRQTCEPVQAEKEWP